MKVSSAAIFTVVVILFFGISSEAAIMTFDNSPHIGSPGFPHTAPYIEDGITMTADRNVTWIGDSLLALAPVTGHVVHFDGGTVQFDMGGSLFDLVAIGFGFVGIPSTALQITTSSGFMVTLPATDNSPGSPDPFLGTIPFDTYPQFSSLAWFTVYDPTGGACFEFDWIQTAVPGVQIPEPSTFALLATALSGLWLMGRKRVN